MQIRIKTLLLVIVFMAGVSWCLRPFFGQDHFWLVLFSFVIVPAIIVALGVLFAAIYIIWFEPKYPAHRKTVADRSPGLGADPRPLTANYLLRLRPRSSAEFGPSREELRLKPLDDR